MNDMTIKAGEKFGRWEVLEESTSRVYKSGQKVRYYLCRCSCGTVREVKLSSLKYGTSKSCGCLASDTIREKNIAKGKAIVGNKFGRLTPIKKIGQDAFRGSIYLCSCECGNSVEVRGGNLVSGNTRSCGCLRNETLSRISSTHHESKTRLYRIYQAMKRRCYNTNSKDYEGYGGRGIQVCEEWKTNYECFRDWALVNGYEDHLTLDRIDNEGNYELKNCRWVNAKVQANNKSNNVRISWSGKTMNLGEWAKELGMSYSALYKRIYRYDWSIEDAFTKEVKQ